MTLFRDNRACDLIKDRLSDLIKDIIRDPIIEMLIATFEVD